MSACDFSPAGIRASLQKEDTNDVADAYYTGGASSVYGQAARAELEARNAIPPADWGAIDQREVAVGMGPISVEAAWGYPTAINTTTTAQGQDDQWVYRPCDTCSASYVYFTDGRVTAIQN